MNELHFEKEGHSPIYGKALSLHAQCLPSTMWAVPELTHSLVVSTTEACIGSSHLIAKLTSWHNMSVGSWTNGMHPIGRKRNIDEIIRTASVQWKVEEQINRTASEDKICNVHQCAYAGESGCLMAKKACAGCLGGGYHEELDAQRSIGFNW